MNNMDSEILAAKNRYNYSNLHSLKTVITCLIYIYVSLRVHM